MGNRCFSDECIYIQSGRQFEIADRISILVDAADYFKQVRSAFERARREIWILGWDFNPDIILTSTTRFQTPLIALNVQWMIFQALLAVLPFDLSRDAINGLQKRFTAYLIKAPREAKVATSWESVKVAYEAQLSDYVSALLATDNATFLREFHDFCEPYARRPCKFVQSHLNEVDRTRDPRFLSGERISAVRAR